MALFPKHKDEAGIYPRSLFLKGGCDHPFDLLIFFAEFGIYSGQTRQHCKIPRKYGLYECSEGRRLAIFANFVGWDNL